LLFGLGVFLHLLRHGRRYDVVHTASFPYFSLLAAGATRRRGGFAVVVDWHELWTREYWCDYLGRLGGWIGWRVQRACLRVPQRAFCFSRLHERRLREQEVNGTVTRLDGQYTGPTEASEPRPARPGAVSPSAEARDLAAAIIRIHSAGPALRNSAAEWFRRNAERLSFERSFGRVLEAYAEG